MSVEEINSPPRSPFRESGSFKRERSPSPPPSSKSRSFSPLPVSSHNTYRKAPRQEYRKSFKSNRFEKTNPLQFKEKDHHTGIVVFSIKCTTCDMYRNTLLDTIVINDSGDGIGIDMLPKRTKSDSIALTKNHTPAVHQTKKVYHICRCDNEAACNGTEFRVEIAQNGQSVSFKRKAI